jgi:hypothetical protein
MSDNFEEWLISCLDLYMESEDGAAKLENSIDLLEAFCRRKNEAAGTNCDWRESGRLRRKILDIAKTDGFSGTPEEQKALHKTALWCEEREESGGKTAALQFYLAEADSLKAAGKHGRAKKIEEHAKWLILCGNRDRKNG